MSMPTIATLAKLSTEELRTLNHRVVALLNDRHRQKAAATLASFGIGDRVSFAGPHGIPCTGVIDKINQKTATLRNVTGYAPYARGLVRVGASLLRPAR